MMLTQVNGAPVVAEDQSSYQKPKISIVINEERYEFFYFLALPYLLHQWTTARLTGDLNFSVVGTF